jgi:hypothetical protein
MFLSSTRCPEACDARNQVSGGLPERGSSGWSGCSPMVDAMNAVDRRTLAYLRRPLLPLSINWMRGTPA